MLKNGVIQQCDKLAKITKYLHSVFWDNNSLAASVFLRENQWLMDCRVQQIFAVLFIFIDIHTATHTSDQVA